MQPLDNWSDYLTHIDNSLGGVRPEPFERIVEQSLTIVSRWVPPIDGKLRGLPKRVTDILSKPDTEPGVLDVDAAGAALHDESGLALGRCVEFLLTALRCTDDALDDEGRKHFRRNLSDDIVASFDRATPTRGTRKAGTGRTLADGKPGAAKNVAEHGVAEEDSPAATTSPHEETKLSTSKGLGQERRKRTLAEGKPGSSRPIADEKS